MKYTLKIDGMSCGNCVKHIQDVLNETEGIISNDVKLSEKSAIIETSREFIKDELEEIIDEADYTLVSVE